MSRNAFGCLAAYPSTKVPLCKGEAGGRYNRGALTSSCADEISRSRSAIESESN